MGKNKIIFNLLVGVGYIILIVRMIQGSTEALYWLVGLASLNSYINGWIRDIEKILKKEN
jgi:uncharacterized membrane protein YobD (UPF0266 family)